MAPSSPSSTATSTLSLSLLIVFVLSVIVIMMRCTCASTTAMGITRSQLRKWYAGERELDPLHSSATEMGGRPTSPEPRRVLLSNPCGASFQIGNSDLLSCAAEFGSGDLVSTLFASNPHRAWFTWSSALSPKDESMFVLVADHVWLRRTNGEGILLPSTNGTLFAGPWPPPDNLKAVVAIAVYDPDLSTDGSKNTTAGKTVGRRVLFVSDAANLMLRVFLVPSPENAGAPTEPYELSYSNFTDGKKIMSLACDSLRHVLYATSDSQVLKMTLKGTVEFVGGGVAGGEATSVRLVSERATFQSWIGSSLSVGDNDGGDDSRTVRFNEPFVSSSAISTDGEILYVVDRGNDIIRRIWTVNGSVETIAGQAGKAGAKDGALLSAILKQPQGLALMPDGCNMFISEFAGGRIKLIHFDSVGKGSSSGEVTTIASLSARGSGRDSSQGWDLSSLSMTPNAETLYVGGWNQKLFQLTVNKAALPPCSSSVTAALSPGSDTGAALSPGSNTGAAPSRASITGAAPSPESNTGAASSPHSKTSSFITIGATTGLALLVLGAAIAASRILIVRRRRRSQQGSEQQRVGTSPSPADTTPVTSLAEWSLSQPSADLENRPAGGSAEAGGRELRPAGPRRYSLAELRTACDGFSQRRLLGQGGAAEVYKGVLSGGEVVAVKLMKGEEFSAGRFRQFQAELAVLGSIRHRHLCSIVGYCTEEDKSSIVYPFVEGGTLYDRLHSPSSRHHDPAVPAADGETQWIGKATDSEKLDEEERSDTEEGNTNAGSLSGAPPLDWSDRLAIARQIARALHYLHEEVDPPIIHRDIKSKNVLLGSRRNGRAVRACLSDFGLAKLGQSVFEEETAGETVETYHVAGTMGYMAPEYFRHCRLTAKNDVYAFGVLLLELVSGRKPFGEVSTHQEEEGAKEDNADKTLVAWVKRKLVELAEEEEGEGGEHGQELSDFAVNLKVMKIEHVRQIADRALEKLGVVDWRAVYSMFEVAMMCVQDDPNQRPSMGTVLERLPGRVGAGMVP